MPAVSGCPGDLSATGKKRWEIAKASIKDWHDEYAPTLDTYIRCLEVADKAWESLTASGVLVLTAAGSMGQTVTAPEWKVWREAKMSAADAARQLGLTPDARAKMGEPKAPSGADKFAGRV